MDLLQATPKTANDLKCPHGVQFYDVAEGTARSQRAAWSYEAPQPARAQVDHWIGFWEDVEARVSRPPGRCSLCSCCYAATSAKVARP